MDKRAWSRQPLDHPATYGSDVLPEQPCRIRDWCPGGLMVVCQNSVAELLHPGESLQVRFAGDNQDHALEMVARRVAGNQVGLAFATEPGAAARDALDAAARQYAAEQTKAAANFRLENVERDNLLEAIRKEVADLEPVLKSFMTEVGNALLLAASESTSNMEHSQYFEALTQFRKFGDIVIKRVLKSVDKRVVEPAPVEQPGVKEPEEPSELKLVEQNEFEDWLLVSTTTGHIEEKYAEELARVRDGLEIVYGISIDNQNNPVGPATICHALRETAEPALISEQVQQLFFRELEVRLSPELGKLYRRITAHLDAGGVRQHLEAREAERREKRKRETRARAHVPEGTRRTEPETPPQGAGAGGPGAGGGVGGGAGGGPGSAADMATLRSLYELAGGGGGGGGTGHFQVNEILQEIGRLQQSQPDSLAGDQGLAQVLLQQLEKDAEEGDRTLAPEHRLSVDVTDAVFGSVFGSRHLLEDMRPWLRSLRVPLLKVLLQDESFMEDKQHAARQVVNQMVRLSSANAPGSAGLQSTLEQYASKIVDEYDGQSSVFNEVLQAISPLVERQSSAYLRNLKRVQNLREGQEKLHNARLRVAKEITAHIGERPVPHIFKRIIEGGWRDLLVLTLIREGEESADWGDYTNVLDLLLAWLKPQAQRTQKTRDEGFPSHVARVIDILRRGFEAASVDPFESDPLLELLNKVLLEQAKDPGPQLSLEYLDEEILKPTPPWAEDEILASGSAAETAAIWTRRAKRMRSGDGLLVAPGTKVEERLRLAWKAKDNSRYVFVDEQGREARQLNMEELVRELSEKKAELVAGEDMPIVEEGILETIQHVYEELAHNAAHDEVTGLANRKEFERLLEDAVVSAKRDAVNHAVCFFDLDQFKVINASLGHKIGDRFLDEIGDVLQESAGKGAHVARLGGDEFGVLLIGCDCGPALERADAMRTAVSKFEFEWEGEQHSLTTSVGMVEITPFTPDIDRVLKAGDHACYTAKDAGRNKVQLYAEADTAVNRKRSVMEWVSRINRAVEEDRFRLRIQRIAPLRKGLPPGPAEVLLSIVKDEQSTAIPGELLHAAEAYGRMNVIDRWVVSHALAWMAEHPELARKAGGLAINLSGQSLGDEEFLPFVLDEMRDSAVAPELLCFEITETQAIANLEYATDFIEEVKSLGCAFALDDFGSGLSSYSYLKNLPVDFLKIDGSFVREIATSPSDFAMVRSINEIAHFLDKRTVAECVESKEAVAKLREVGVDYAQGFMVEKPLFMDEIGG